MDRLHRRAPDYWLYLPVIVLAGIGVVMIYSASSIVAADRYVASFVGMAPASRPRVVIAVMIDEPSAGQYYGGAVAAPVFSQVAAGTLRFLAVPPDAPAGTTVLAPEEVPLVREEV